MRKLIIIMLLLLPIVAATEECQRVELNIPCLVTSTWKPADCNTPVTITNESGHQVQELNWSNSTVFCEFLFNHTKRQTFIYNSTIEDGAVTVRDDTMMPIAMLIMLPFLFGVALLIGGISLGKEHTAIKIGIFLLVPVTFFASLHLGTLTVVEYYDFPALENLLGTTVYWVGIIFFFIVSYFFIYLFYTLSHQAAQRKNERLEY